jgi:hypothetical protein
MPQVTDMLPTVLTPTSVLGSGSPGNPQLLADSPSLTSPRMLVKSSLLLPGFSLLLLGFVEKGRPAEQLFFNGMLTARKSINTSGFVDAHSQGLDFIGFRTGKFCYQLPSYFLG